MMAAARFDSDFATHPSIDVLQKIKTASVWKPLKSLATTLTSGHTPYLHDVSEGEVGFITIECVDAMVFHRHKLKRIDREHYEKEFSKKRIKRGAVVCTIKRRICKAFPFLDDPPEPMAINQDIALIYPSPEICQPAYLAAYLSSDVGQSFADRQKTEQMNPYISVESLGTLPIVLLSQGFQTKITETFRSAQSLSLAAVLHVQQAEQTLLQALGLKSWQPPEPLTYTRSASDALAASRIDAEYFAPRVAQLLAKLSADGLTIQDVAPARHDAFDPAKHPAESFEYIEISGLRSDGTATSEATPTDEAPSRASQKVHHGDIITSTVRPIRRLSAIISPEQNGYVCSSGFVVLNPTRIAPEVLLTYLRLPVVCELMDLHTSASLYPAISERDLLKLPIPKIPDQAAAQITTQVRQAHAARQQAQELLATAKRAVEVAIDKGEAEGMKVLGQPIHI